MTELLTFDIEIDGKICPMEDGTGNWVVACDALSALDKKNDEIEELEKKICELRTENFKLKDAMEDIHSLSREF